MHTNIKEESAQHPVSVTKTKKGIVVDFSDVRGDVAEYLKSYKPSIIRFAEGHFRHPSYIGLKEPRLRVGVKVVYGYPCVEMDLIRDESD